MLQAQSRKKQLWTSSIPGAYEDRTGLPKSKRKKRETVGIIEEEKQLEALVFGERELHETGCDLVNISSDESEYEIDKLDNGGHQQTVLENTAAWKDDDDEMIRVDIAAQKGLRKLRQTEEETEISGREYTNRLRAQFQKLSQQPLWSLADNDRPHSDYSTDDDDDSDDNNDDDILRHTSNLLATSVTKLPGGVLNIKKMRDANTSQRAEAVVQSVEFHPNTNIALTAGMHKTLSLFQIDGDKNPHIQSVFLKRFPIQTAHFTTGGEEVVMAASKHWYYMYDIPSGKVMRINEIKGHSKEHFAKFSVSPDDKTLAFLGKDGYISLVSNKTKQWIGDLKMNGGVSDVAFMPDSLSLLSTGSDGHVYVWDMRSTNCVHRFVDEGCIKGTTLGVSPNGQFIAAGSDSGVVNVYDQSCLTQVKPHPLKAVMNLTTGISNVKFNPSSEVLAISSKEKKSAIKLPHLGPTKVAGLVRWLDFRIHLSSLSVFSNWPSARTLLNYVSSIDFSSDSHYMITGDDKGKAPLYRLNHFYKGRTLQ